MYMSNATIHLFFPAYFQFPMWATTLNVSWSGIPDEIFCCNFTSLYAPLKILNFMRRKEGEKRRTKKERKKKESQGGRKGRNKTVSDEREK